MTPTEMLLLAAAAVLLFWVVGAYNRLVAQRTAIGQAWAKVHDALQLRGAAVPALVSALREPMAAEHGALDALLTTHTEAARSASEMTARPVDSARALAWVQAEAAVDAAASRVLALLEQHAELSRQEPLATLTATWHDAQARLPYARQAFNEAAADYNEAVAQFPTNLVARGFSLGRAGVL